MRDRFLLACIILSLLWHGLLLVVFPPKMMPAVEAQKRVFVASAYHPRFELAGDDSSTRLSFRPVENLLAGPKLVSLPGRTYAEKFLFMEGVVENYMPPVDARAIYDKTSQSLKDSPPLARLPLETPEPPGDPEVLFSVEFMGGSDKRALVRGPDTVDFPYSTEKKGREWDAAFRIKVSETGGVVDPAMEGTTGSAEIDKLLKEQTGKMQFSPSGQKSEALVRFKFRLDTGETTKRSE